MLTLCAVLHLSDVILSILCMRLIIINIFSYYKNDIFYVQVQEYLLHELQLHAVINLMCIACYAHMQF